MSGPEALLAFLGESASWQGAAGIPSRLLEHLVLCGLAVLAASLIALPAGFYIGHTGRFQLLGLNLANIGRAVPSYAVMVMVFPVALAAAEPLGFDPRLGLTFLPIFVAMTLLAIPPILVATFAAIAEVDRDIVESSRGMGLTERQILAARRAAPGAAGHHRRLPRRDAAGHRDGHARGGPLGGWLRPLHHRRIGQA